MELALKIVFYAAAWYAIGVLGMQYIRHWWNDGVEGSEYQHIQAREVFTLAILGLVVIIFIAVMELQYQWSQLKDRNQG